jgi:hypothetical protein
VVELVMIVHEDRPRDGEIAVVDDLVELVLELQGSVAGIRTELDRVADVRRLPAHLPDIDAAVAAGSARYWRDLRSHGPVAELRSAARRRGIEFRTWQHSVEESQLRCEPGIDRVVAAVRAAWREVGELLILHLPSPAPAGFPHDPPAAGTADGTPMTTRRPS